jgi:hypothetical protein
MLPQLAGFQCSPLDRVGQQKKGQKPRVFWAFRPWSDFVGLLIGGAEGDRTPDLCIANAPLSQLSYGPDSDV